MNKDRKPRRRALALAAALATTGGAGLALVMATTAGAVTSTAPATTTTRTQGVTSSQSPAGTAVATQSSSTASAAPPASAAPITAPARSSSGNPATTDPPRLTATQLPAASAEKWDPAGPPSTRDITGHDITENECFKAEGANTWTQQAFYGGDGQNTAIQDSFTFSSAGAAESAYQDAVTGMDACRQTSVALQQKNGVTPDAKVAQTASGTAAAAWKRTWTGVMGMSADSPQTNHIYLAVNGARLIVLQFTEFPGQAAPYDTAGDPQVLTMLTDELAE